MNPDWYDGRWSDDSRLAIWNHVVTLDMAAMHQMARPMRAKFVCSIVVESVANDINAPCFRQGKRDTQIFEAATAALPVLTLFCIREQKSFKDILPIE